MKIYWWIERKDGCLVTFGRSKYVDGNIAECGCPRLLRTMKEAKELCRTGEHPVKVEIRRVEE